MPELPEVETVRRVMERALKGKRIAEVDARKLYLPAADKGAAAQQPAAAGSSSPS